MILYVWGEDPVRSLMRCRWAVFYPRVTRADHDMRLFSGNPWVHVEIDLESGSFAEAENPLRTPESLYTMCDPQWMLDHLRDDLAMQLAVYAGDPGYGRPGRIGELDRPKNALNYTSRTDHFPGPAAPWDGTRRDQEILGHLTASGIPFFDMNDVHQGEYEQAGGAYHEYLSQYMNGGHYNPRGNHFFAYAIKDTLVGLLDPKPLPYRDQDPDTTDFSVYRTSA